MSQRSVISPTCTLFHPWVLCTICCIVIVMVLSGIDVPSDYFLKCSNDRHGGCSHDYHSFANSTMCLNTVALLLHSKKTPTYTPQEYCTQTHTYTHWHQTLCNTWQTHYIELLYVHSVKIIYNIAAETFYCIYHVLTKWNVYRWQWRELFFLS